MAWSRANFTFTFYDKPQRYVHFGNRVNNPRLAATWVLGEKFGARKALDHGDLVQKSSGLRLCGTSVICQTFVHFPQKPSSFDLWWQNFRTDLLVFVTLLISGQAPSVTFESVTNYQHLHYRTLIRFFIISIMCMSNRHWPQVLLMNCSTLWSVFLFSISFPTSILLINMLIGFYLFIYFIPWTLLPTHCSVEGYCYIWRHSHYTRLDSPGRRMGPSQRPLHAPHITFTRDKHPCPRRGIRTRNPSKPADADACLRPRDHRGGPVPFSTHPVPTKHI
jgi:hypothetical protein